jgi:hypothetical protein
MDALGTKCGSEDCTQVLKIQDGSNAIGCTKAQQAKEDIGSTSCKFCSNAGVINNTDTSMQGLQNSLVA